MDQDWILEVARRARGLTQVQLAGLSKTSQATLSAYERGLKSPTLKVAARIFTAMDYEMTLQARVSWKEHHPTGIHAFWVPNMVWSVPPPECFVRLNFDDTISHGRQHKWDLRDREERRRAYELLIRRGWPQQMIRWMDCALLIDLWEELDLPPQVREAWEPTLSGARRTRDVSEHAPWYSEMLSVHDAPTARAWVLQPLPQPPAEPVRRRKQRRTRFDPRPPEPD